MIKISGSAKIGIIDGDRILLSRKSKNNKKMQLEYDMLETLLQLHFPVPRFLMKTTNGEYVIEQEYIKDANLYKLSSYPHSFTEVVKEQIKEVIHLLEKHQMLISDLQFLYTTTKLYIIDPNNIFFLSPFRHFDEKIRYKRSYVWDKYLQQIKILKQLIE